MQDTALIIEMWRVEEDGGGLLREGLGGSFGCRSVYVWAKADPRGFCLSFILFCEALICLSVW